MIKVGLVGCGTIAPFHLEVIKPLDEAIVQGIYDIDSNAYPSFDPHNTYPRYETYEAMVQDDSIDVIHVLTPHHTHYELTKLALEHHKHVLVEKPFVLTTVQAEKLIALAKRNQCHLAVCLQHRTDETTHHLKQVIESSSFGRLLGVKAFVHWKRTKEYYNSPWRGFWETEGGGTLINQAIHTLDLLHHLVGPVESVQGRILNLDHPYIEVEDNSYLLLKFANDVTGIFSSSNSFAKHTGVQLEFHFESGALYQIDEVLYQLNEGTLHPIVQNKARDGNKAYFGSGHERVIQDFYQAIQTNGTNYIKAEDTLDVLRTLETIYNDMRCCNERLTI